MTTPIILLVCAAIVLQGAFHYLFTRQNEARKLVPVKRRPRR